MPRPRLASVGMPGWLQSEQVAGFDRNLEASVRSRDMNDTTRSKRDVIEAGLN